MQIHVGLGQLGWSKRTRDMSHVCFLVSLKKFFALFFGSHRARTSGPILMTYTSYDMFLCKEAPFGVAFILICTKFGVMRQIDPLKGLGG